MNEPRELHMEELSRIVRYFREHPEAFAPNEAAVIYAFQRLAIWTAETKH